MPNDRTRSHVDPSSQGRPPSGREQREQTAAGASKEAPTGRTSRPTFPRRERTRSADEQTTTPERAASPNAPKRESDSSLTLDGTYAASNSYGQPAMYTTGATI